MMVALRDRLLLPSRRYKLYRLQLCMNGPVMRFVAIHDSALCKLFEDSLVLAKANPDLQ